MWKQKKELEEIDVDDLEQTQEKKYDSLVEDLGKGLEKEISEYTKISNYKYAIKHLTSISEVAGMRKMRLSINCSNSVM